MNLKQWCELDECIYSGETDEHYKQHAGLDYSEKLIEQLAEIKLSNSKIFIDFFWNQEETHRLVGWIGL